MSDAVLTFVLIVLFLAAMAAARFFKIVEAGFFHAAQTPVVAGAIAGIVLLLVRDFATVQAAVCGVLMTVAAVWVRHTGNESEAADGMILGALTGAAAAIPLAFSGTGELQAFSRAVLSGTIAGYGITFAAFHVADRTRQLVIDAVTGAFAIIAASAPMLIAETGVSDRSTAVAVAAAVPLAAVAVVFKQWSDVRAELAHEAALGFLSDSDVEVTAHPLKRFGSGGWIDRAAHRKFVRLASRIALRKRQQRNRADEMARLYQIEIIKLRMQLQEMTGIDREARAHRDETEDGDSPSDKMPA
jgi:hypothetical protein